MAIYELEKGKWAWTMLPTFSESNLKGADPKRLKELLNQMEKRFKECDNPINDEELKHVLARPGFIIQIKNGQFEVIST